VSTPDPGDIAHLRTVVDGLAQAAQSVMALVEDLRADAARRGIDVDEPLALAVRNARYLRGFLIDTGDWIEARGRGQTWETDPSRETGLMIQLAQLLRGELDQRLQAIHDYAGDHGLTDVVAELAMTIEDTGRVEARLIGARAILDDA